MIGNKTYKYILDKNGQPIPCDDLMEWGEWMEESAKNMSRVLSRTVIGTDPEIYVSTVFLGLDHSHCPNGPPILWESMCFKFDGKEVACFDDIQERYRTRAEAIEGHLQLVDELRKRK